MFKNIRSHSSIDPKDDNKVNFLTLILGSIEDGSTHRIRNKLRRVGGSHYWHNDRFDDN